MGVETYGRRTGGRLVEGRGPGTTNIRPQPKRRTRPIQPPATSLKIVRRIRRKILLNLRMAQMVERGGGGQGNQEGEASRPYGNSPVVVKKERRIEDMRKGQGRVSTISVKSYCLPDSILRPKQIGNQCSRELGGYRLGERVVGPRGSKRHMKDIFTLEEVNKDVKVRVKRSNGAGRAAVPMGKIRCKKNKKPLHRRRAAPIDQVPGGEWRRSSSDIGIISAIGSRGGKGKNSLALFRRTRGGWRRKTVV